MFHRYSSIALLGSVFVASALPAQVFVTKPFQHTGAMVTFTVPNCVASITADVRGAQGGGANNGSGGFGGRSQAVITVTPGEVLEIWVGGAGTYTTSSATGGFNGGGGHSSQGFGGTGGGASDIRRGSGLSNRIIVAGGGGGGTDSELEDRPGGTGGGASGGPGGAWSGWPTSGGQGGTQVSGGMEGTACCFTATPGSFGAGGFGAGDLAAGGGGGGGWYGGGGGLFGGGGGGSGYFDASTISNSVSTSGYQQGHGLILLTYTVLPVSAVASPSAICTGSSTTLSASGMVSYTWSAGANGASVNVSPSVSAVYTVEATSSMGCPAVGEVSVDVTPAPPALTAQSSASDICPGESVILTATGASNISWSGGVTNGIAFQPQATGIYTVSGSNICGTSFTTVPVTVHGVSLSTAVSSTAICSGGSATLQAGGTAVTFTWNSPGGAEFSQSIIVSPAVTTVYTLTGRNDFGCSAAIQATVLVNPTPTVVINTTSTSVCKYSTVSFHASGAATFTWFPGGQTGAAATVAPVSSGVYSVTGTSAAGCSSQATVGITVKPVPMLQVVASRTFVCAKSNVFLTASGASSYLWNNGQTSASVCVSPTAPTIYTVTGYGSNGCSAKKTIFIDVMQSPYSVPASTTACKGTAVSLYAPYGGSYSWSTGECSQSITVTPYKNTVYTYAVSAYSNGITCSLSGTIQVIILNNPVVKASASPTMICAGQPVVLSATGATSYTWQPGGIGQTVTVTASQSVFKYKVHGTDANGCEATDYVQVKVNTCTSVDEIQPQNQALNVYPNPNNGEFSLRSSGRMEILLINGLGQLIGSCNLDEGNDYRASFSGLARGVYLACGMVNGRATALKVVVE